MEYVHNLSSCVTRERKLRFPTPAWLRRRFQAPALIERVGDLGPPGPIDILIAAGWLGS